MKYVRYTKNGRHLYEHREVWEQHNGPIPDKMEIHHINGKHDDNRIENLALVTHKQNKLKMDRVGKGFYFKRGKYVAQRNLEGKRTNLGSYGTPAGAMIANRMAYVNK